MIQVHDSVLKWVPEVLTPQHVTGRRVVEVGSYDVNGTVRPIVEALAPASYLGVDLEAGPGVDDVCPLGDVLPRFGQFDLVICTEVLEHVVDWKASLVALADLVRPGGTLLVTTRSEGFPYHPHPVDTWRYTTGALADAVQRLSLVVEQVETDPQVPGVFLLARKPAHRAELLDLVHGVTAMSQETDGAA